MLSPLPRHIYSACKDPAWKDLLKYLGTAFGPPGPDHLIQHRFMLCEAPTGPGRTVEAGSGSWQGLWLTLGSQDGLPFPVVRALIQDRQGNLWFATDGGGVCRYDGEWFTTLITEDGLGHGVVEEDSSFTVTIPAELRLAGSE